MTHILLKSALAASAATLLIAAGPKADLNQDGQVTKAEFTEAAQAHFAAVDTNGDSLLSEDERQGFRTAKIEDMKTERFNKLDADGDGAISRTEMDAIGEKMEARKAEMETRKQEFMQRYDTNLDGELSDAEKTAMKAERDAKRGDSTRGKGMRGEGKRGEGMRGKGQRSERPNPDANGDGFVSLDEHLAVSEQLFTRLDANADGVLTEGEGKKRRGKFRR